MTKEPIAPPFELGDEVNVIENAADAIGLNSSIIYKILAVKLNESCEIDDEDDYCSKFCEFRTICRKGVKRFFQLIAVGDVEEFYPASYFEKAV